MSRRSIPHFHAVNMNSHKTVVLDVFGTLAYIQRPHRAYSILREALAPVDAAAFGRLAMTRPLTPAGVVAALGRRMDPQALDGIERLLWDEVASVRLYPETLAVLGELLAQGTRVVLGSNLALPFGSALEPLLDAVGPWQRLDEQPSGQALTAYSYDLGHLKPDPLFYAHIQQAVGGEILMAGDRREEDWQAPTRAGWRACWLKREDGYTLLDAMLALGLLR